MEEQNRNRLKALLTGIAAVLICLHLIGVALQQPNVKVSSDSLPTLSAVSTLQVAGAGIVSGQTACTATVRARQLNQRSGPGESYEIIGGANRGEVFTIAGWDATQQWVQINTVDGAAWMAARYVTLGSGCDNASSSTTNLARPTVIAAVSTPIPQRTTPVESITAGDETTTGLSSIFTPEVLYWSDEIEAWAEKYKIDVNLIATVMQIESCGNATIHSSAGAQGLFQVMPFHFEAGEDMLDVETNARRGLTYLQGALRLARGEAGLALVGYNGGYGAISGNWAAETRRYYYWGSGIYAEATSGAATSPTLQEWLAAGGKSLCQSASRSQQLMSS